MTMGVFRTSFFNQADQKYGFPKFRENITANTGKSEIDIKMNVADKPDDDKYVYVHFTKPVDSAQISET